QQSSLAAAGLERRRTDRSSIPPREWPRPGNLPDRLHLASAWRARAVQDAEPLARARPSPESHQRARSNAGMEAPTPFGSLRRPRRRDRLRHAASARRTWLRAILQREPRRRALLGLRILYVLDVGCRPLRRQQRPGRRNEQDLLPLPGRDAQ